MELTEIRIPLESFDPETHKIVRTDRVVDEIAGTVTLRPVVAPLDVNELAAIVSENAALLTEAKTARKAAATTLRWVKETGGIVINGVRVATDDRSKTLILGKRAQAQSNPTMSFRWKAASGDWVDLTGAQIIAIADAVGNHVQACFDREGDLHDLIDAAETAEDALAVDIVAGWP